MAIPLKYNIGPISPGSARCLHLIIHADGTEELTDGTKSFLVEQKEDGSVAQSFRSREAPDVEVVGLPKSIVQGSVQPVNGALPWEDLFTKALSSEALAPRTCIRLGKALPQNESVGVFLSAVQNLGLERVRECSVLLADTTKKTSEISSEQRELLLSFWTGVIEGPMIGAEKAVMN